MTNPPIDVVIVSFNTRELLIRCLESLAPDNQSGIANVCVIDNRSSDGSLEAARTTAPWARVLDAGANLGFGSAINRAAEDSQTRWLVAANADLEFEPGSLRALLDAGERSSAGCVVPRLILPDGSTQHSVHPLPTVPFTLAFNLGYQRVNQAWAERNCLEGHWDAEIGREIPWGIGACMLLRREAFTEAGGFDVEQWMYAEDLDICWRLHDSGWSIRYEPSARVRHEASPATDAAFGSAKTATFMAATYEMLTRRRGSINATVIAIANVLGAAVRLTWALALAPFSERQRHRARVHRQWLGAHARWLRHRASAGSNEPR